MIQYSDHITDKIFIKSYGFLSFAKNMGKNIIKNISKNLSGKYRLNLIMLNNLKQTHLKLVFEKTAGTTGDLIGLLLFN